LRASLASNDSRLQADLRELLLRPEFRRFVMFLYDDPTWCGVPGDIDEPTHPELARRLGRRSIGVQLMHWAQRANPEMAQRVVTEWTNFCRETAALSPETKES
jgi:hypothetical protein